MRNASSQQGEKRVAARGFAEPNSESEEVQIETPAASPPRRRRKRYHSLNDDSETD